MKAFANSCDAVCSFQIRALSMYFSTSISPIHSIVSSYCACAEGKDGWLSRLASTWSSVDNDVVVFGSVVRGCGVVVVVIEVSNKAAEEEEEK